MVFILSALWWIRGLWKLPDGRDWLRGKLGLVLMGRAMLSKSLIQFSVDGQGCVPFLLFDLRPNYGGRNEGKATSFKRSHPRIAALSAPSPAAGPCPPMPPSQWETPWHSWASLGRCLGILWGHCSFLLDTGVHKVLFLSSRSLFPQSCGSYVIKSHCPLNSHSIRVLSPFADPQFEKSVVGPRTFLKVLEFLWHNCSAVCGFLLSSGLVGLNWFDGAEYSYLLLVCKTFHLPTEHEWYPYSVEYSCL